MSNTDAVLVAGGDGSLMETGIVDLAQNVLKNRIDDNYNNNNDDDMSDGFNAT